jgi:hypothetical protein
MNYGSLPPEISRALPLGEIEPDHRPDGLSDEVIDALINEASAQVPEPPTLYLGADERRRVRRHVRQLTRRLTDIEPGEVA